MHTSKRLNVTKRTAVYAVALAIVSALALSAGIVARAQVVTGQAVDESGAPQYRVDPFWPKPLPNRWSMQQVTGISVDPMDNVWFLNRPNAPEQDEIGGDGTPAPVLCCVRGPELIQLDQQGNVLTSWGGAGHPKWPLNSQTVIADSKGNIWISGTNAQDSIIKYTRDGKVLWDFDHRPPAEAGMMPENNQETNALINKGRFQLDEVANELYIIQQKRVLIYDASTGAYKRGWGGHGMPLSEITNDPIPGYKWTGGPPPEEKNFVPDLHFVEISRDRRVYIGERGANRIQVFTTEGKWLQDIMVSPNTPARGCGGVASVKGSPCGTTYKLAISRDPQQKYLFVADGHNFVIWMLDRQSGKTLGYFGGNGRLAGQLHFPNAVATDSRGNIYTGEVDTGKRIQKFAPVMARR
jgi:hypothetical protein